MKQIYIIPFENIKIILNNELIHPLKLDIYNKLDSELRIQLFLELWELQMDFINHNKKI